jgi:hypothetical protein
VRVTSDGLIEYDVTDVPFPLERDPGIDGAKPKRGRRKRRKPLDPAYERYRLYTEEELEQYPPVKWYIKDHLAIGELTCFYGKGATYKSFLALDWSCHLALHGVLVVYIVAEGASGIRARITAWKKHHGVERLPNLRLMPSNVNLHQTGAVDTFIAAMKEQLGDQKPGLVVVDTLARNFVGGNESSPEDMGMFVEGVEKVRREFQTAVLIIHHTTKDGETERGTESLRNASFAMFKFKLENQSLMFKFTCDRMKEAEEPPERRVWLKKVALPELSEEDNEVSSLVALWPYDGVDSGRSAATRIPESRPEISGRQRRLLRALTDPNRDPNHGALAKRLRTSESTIKRELKSLVDKGFLVAQGDTRAREYSLTDSGKEAAE